MRYTTWYLIVWNGVYIWATFWILNQPRKCTSHAFTRLFDIVCVSEVELYSMVTALTDFVRCTENMSRIFLVSSFLQVDVYARQYGYLRTLDTRVFQLPRLSPILLLKILKLCLTIKLTEMLKKIGFFQFWVSTRHLKIWKRR